MRTLKQLLDSPGVEYIMEAHDAVSARLAAEAGFGALWASSLTIATAHGVADINLLSTSDILHVAEHIADSTDVPVLLDGDSGHGGTQHVARFARRCARRGIAGICIEDQLFPKRNSLLGGDYELEDPAVFAQKIAAAKNAADLVVVARIESFIAKRSLEDALRRADQYWEAGADAILIHSRARDAAEVLAFRERWSKGPVVIAPTTYADTPAEKLACMSAVIWANHMLRASIAGMRRVAQQMREHRGEPQGQLAELEGVLAMNHK